MRTTQRKGDIAVSQAITTFTRYGYDVSLPLTESARYDLVVDIEGILKKVQVRFSKSGEVDLRNIHSNSNGYVLKKAKRGDYDWLYVLKGNGQEFLIKNCLEGRRSIDPGYVDILSKVLKNNGGVA